MVRLFVSVFGAPCVHMCVCALAHACIRACMSLRTDRQFSGLVETDMS